MFPPRPTAVYDEVPRSRVASLLYVLVFLTGALAAALMYAVPITALFTINLDDTYDLATNWSFFWNGCALALTGLICGTAFLLRFRFEGEVPSAAFIFLVPFFGVPIHAVVVSGILFQRRAWDLADAVIPHSASTFFLILFLIPISLPYILGLRWFHNVVWNWTGSDSRRLQRHALYAVSAMWLLILAELPRSYDRLRQREAERAMAKFDMKPPGRMTLLGYLAWDDIGYSEESFYRIEGRMNWPPSPVGTAVVTEQAIDEEDRTVFKSILGQTLPNLSQLSSARWQEGELTTTALRLQTPTHDYIQLRRY